MMDALYQTGCGLDVKTATGANRYTTQIRSRLFAGSDHGLDQISGLKSEHALAPHKVSTREAMLR